MRFEKVNRIYEPHAKKKREYQHRWRRNLGERWNEEKKTTTTRIKGYQRLQIDEKLYFKMKTEIPVCNLTDAW